jgi:hypothetical protein
LNFDFHPKVVRQWLVDSGFIIERQLTVSHFRMRLIKKLIPLKLLVAMESVLQLTGNWWQLTPSVFVRARAGLEGRSGCKSPEPGAPTQVDPYGCSGYKSPEASALTEADPYGRSGYRSPEASTPAGKGFFRCPECGHALPDETEGTLTCPVCARRWAVRDGIYDFREALTG